MTQIEEDIFSQERKKNSLRFVENNFRHLENVKV